MYNLGEVNELLNRVAICTEKGQIKMAEHALRRALEVVGIEKIPQELRARIELAKQSISDFRLQDR